MEKSLWIWFEFNGLFKDIKLKIKRNNLSHYDQLYTELSFVSLLRFSSFPAELVPLTGNATKRMFKSKMAAEENPWFINYEID